MKAAWIMGMKNLLNRAVVLKTKTPFVFVTTIHKDVTDRLMQVNPALAKEARKVLDVNKSERHIRGGLATKEKYLHQHEIRI